MVEVWVTVKAVKMEKKDGLREIWKVGSPGEEADYICLPGNKTPQTGWFKQQEFIVSQFWRPEVGGGRVGSL